ncbi:HD domain-containing phosphohydrolase [Desulfocurvus sp. DL9XJH121]
MVERTVLLVDDEPELLEVNRETLESCGHRVLTAGNGLDALEVLSSHPVDLVVTDLRMPRLDGRQLLARMRERGQDADVIFLTGYGTVESAVECIRLGAADYLLKPFDIREFLTKVDKVLEERGLRQRDKKHSESDGVGELDRLLNLGTALREQRDVKSLVKEFLLQIRETFEPDGMALFLKGRLGPDLDRNVVWGPLMRQCPRALRWFEAVSGRLMESGSPRLFESLAVDTGAGKQAVSAMVCPLSQGSDPLGAVVVARSKARAYSMPSLQMLSVFAGQAATAMESLSFRCRLNDMNLEVITSHVCSVEAKDIYTRGHSERVGAFSAQLGEEMGLPKREVELLSFAGILHDVGKIGIPDSILNKPDRLSEGEMAVMRQHPVMGRDILSSVHTLKDVLPMVYHHHERVDGRGYPDGLAGDSIPFLARIVSVADGYEAMTSDRAYQQARFPEEALRILSAGAGGQWDENVVRAWCRLHERGKVAV